jgi:hypothetical protein
MLNRTISVLVFGFVGILSAGIVVSGFINTVSAKVVCVTGPDGKAHCFDFEPIEPEHHTLTPLLPPHPPHPIITHPTS